MIYHPVIPEGSNRESILRPRESGEMKIGSFITEASVIRQILEHLNLWNEKRPRDPPDMKVPLHHGEIVYESFGACAELDSVMDGLKSATPSQ